MKVASKYSLRSFFSMSYLPFCVVITAYVLRKVIDDL